MTLPFDWSLELCATLRIEFYERLRSLKHFNPKILCGEGYNKKTLEHLYNISADYVTDNRLKTKTGSHLTRYQALSLAGWLLTGMGVIDHLVVKNGHSFYNIKCVDTVVTMRGQVTDSSVTFPNWNSGVKSFLTPEQLENPVLATKDLAKLFTKPSPKKSGETPAKSGGGSGAPGPYMPLPGAIDAALVTTGIVVCDDSTLALEG